MPYYAKVTCPACRTQFKVPVEQIFDVRVNPAFKNQMLSGSVNVAVCPNCGTAGGLNVPFIYHDPEKEIALLYLPVSAGANEVERQKVAGGLTKQLMDALPMEERKGYLLQPETFINMDTMVRRVLELEGVTDEDLERSRAQQEFFGELLQADRDSWEKLLEDHQDLVDQGFMGMMEYALNMLAQAGDGDENLENAKALYEYLVENHPVAKQLYERAQIVKPFFDEPTRESLLAALVAAPDDETVELLTHSALSLMDYVFFQQLLEKIESAEDEEEKARLTGLRRRILELREEIMAASQDLANARLQLLSKMLATEDPLKMARSHLSELDEAFSFVLQDQLQKATQAGDQRHLESLNRLVGVIEHLLEESMPPEVALARRLLMTPSEEKVDKLLQKNKTLLKEPFFKLLITLEAESREQGEIETADRLAQLLARARSFAGQAAGPEPGSQRPLDAGETSTPSGLIISTRK